MCILYLERIIKQKWQYFPYIASKNHNLLVSPNKVDGTFVTFVGFRFGVSEHVHFQRPLLRVLLLANLTLMPYTHMCVHMSVQVTLLFVPIRAQFATIRFLAGMFAPMQNQIWCATKLLVAVRTLDRFARMQRHVRLQYSVLRKTFVAKFAFVWLFASMHALMAL